MDIEHLLYRLAVALGIGLLTGLERGWRTREAAPGRRAAGIRTFALCGLLGGLVAALGQTTGTAEGTALVLGIGFAAYAAVVAVFEREANRAAETYSATTIVAALLTFVLGAYAVMGDIRVAGATAVAATGILAAREDIHGWVARLTWPELRSALVLLAMTLIVLPLIPDRPIGEVSPREVWLIAIILAGVSFVGYGSVKYFGAERGVLLAALAGGLISSTAVTLTNARRAAAREGSVNLLVAGAAIATAVSFLRAMAIVAVMQPALLAFLAPALVAATLVASAYAAITASWRTAQGVEHRPAPTEFKNPFSFLPVVGFAVFLGFVIVLGRMIGEAYGSQGAILGALGLGLADIDAVTISVARLVPEPLSALGASQAILAAVASNMVTKLVAGVVIGRGRFAVELAIVTVACWAAALAGLWAAGILTAR